MRYGKNASDPALSRFLQCKRNQLGANSASSNLRIHCHRANLREVRTIFFEGQTANHTARVCLNQKVTDVPADFFLSASQQQPLLGVVYDEPKDSGRIGTSRAPRSHKPASNFARRALNSCRAARTAPGAVPPGDERRASADSRVSAVAKFLSNTGENSFSRSTGISRIDFPSFSAAWNTLPATSCASRKGTPKVTK